MGDVGEKLHLMVVAAVLIRVWGSGSLSAQVMLLLISLVTAHANISCSYCCCCLLTALMLMISWCLQVISLASLWWLMSSSFSSSLIGMITCFLPAQLLLLDETVCIQMCA